MDPATEIETTQFLTFTLSDDIFALDIRKVREVLDFTTVTKVPRMPDFMRGVINLRGSVVPVVDLRLRFRMSMTEKMVNTCVIITEVMMDGDTTILECLADSVQEVLELEPEQISPVPKISTIRTDIITGIGKRNGRFIILLDIDRIFSLDELISVQTTREEISRNAES